jgi:hypothetical protein
LALDRKEAILARTGVGRNPLGNLELNHEIHILNGSFMMKQFLYYGGPYIVGEVSGNSEWLAGT